MAKQSLVIGIVGYRDYNDYEEFCEYVDDFIATEEVEVESIVSGGAKGTDKLAERYARDHNIRLVVYKAEWSKYGNPKAAHIRNRFIVEDSDLIIAFLSPKSKGTRNTIAIAEELDVPVHIIYI